MQQKPEMAHTLRKLYRCAEWAKHKYTVLAWPGSKGPQYDGIPEVLASATRDVSAIADAVSRFEPVKLLVESGRLEDARRRFPHDPLRKHPIEIHPIAADDVDLWMRDIAPVFAVQEPQEGMKSQLQGVDFNFNGWGSKMLAKTPGSFANMLLSDLGIERRESSLTLEGGAIETDGEGTLIASESSIINDNRNPGMNRAEVEGGLQATLGIRKCLWVPGLKGRDATDFHIDAVARFAKPGTVLFNNPEPGMEDEWSMAHKQTREILSKETDANGHRLQIIDMTEPRAADVVQDEATLADMLERKEEGFRWVFSYVNYLMVNGGVVFPQFGAAEADAKALKTAREVFADREVVPVTVAGLGLLGGGIHCATQEVPFV